MRNPDTEWCVSHNQLACGMPVGGGKWVGGCRKRIALTATPVFNKPLDMVGLCKAIGTSVEFQDKKFWSLDKQCKTINPHTVKLFQKHTDRVKDDILDLPAIHQETLDFEPRLTQEDAVLYNTHQQSAKRLRMRMEKAGRVASQDLQKLMLLLQRMQQLLVSPRLAQMGAKHFKKNPIEVTNASKRETGALASLHDQLIKLQSEGHARVMVAACHVTIMHIAKAYLQRKGAADDSKSVGEIFIYDGTLSLKQRQEQRVQFLQSRRSVLFLSIGAGGTGLHLVPTRPDTPIHGFCRSVIFWGSRPFSPMQVWQTLKRIHRIGQKHEVFVYHLIARGSVDYAINLVHEDKAGLANAIVDDDWTNCDETGGEWRQKGRIVDMCSPMLTDGTFAPDDPLVPSAPIAQARSHSPELGEPQGEPAPPLSSPFFNTPGMAGPSQPPPYKVDTVPTFRPLGGKRKAEALPAQAQPLKMPRAYMENAALAQQQAELQRRAVERMRQRSVPLPRPAPVNFGPATMHANSALALEAQAGIMQDVIKMEM